MSIGLYEIDALAAQPGVDLVVRLKSVAGEFNAGFLYPLYDSIKVRVADPEAIMVYGYRLVVLSDHADCRRCLRTEVDEIQRQRVIDVYARTLRAVLLPCSSLIFPETNAVDADAIGEPSPDGSHRTPRIS